MQIASSVAEIAATLALGGTFVAVLYYAKQVKKSVEKMNEQREEMSRQREEMQTQTKALIKPVLAGVDDHIQVLWRGTMTQVRANFHTGETGIVVKNVTNSGQGPALNVRVTATSPNDVEFESDRVAHIQPQRDYGFFLRLIRGPGAIQHGLTGRILIDYEDLLGGNYRTTSEWSITEERGTHWQPLATAEEIRFK